jgi:hypothetical protein
MKARTVAIFATTILLGASASAQDPQAGANEMMKCYELEGYKYGMQTCNPPAELVEAVFGKCALEEQKFRDGLMATKRLEGNPSPDELTAYSERMVRGIRSEFRTRIQAQIVDARVTVNKRC